MTEADRNLDDIRALVAARRAGTAWPEERLDALARRYLASSPEGRGRIDPAAFAEMVRREIAVRFVERDREPDPTQTGRMLAAALRRAGRDVEDRTHFIPCRLFDGDGPAGLAVGPVAFQRTPAFQAARADAIAADPELAALIERDFASWSWIAEITVRGCDRSVSRERALSAVDGALDILRLYAGADRAGMLGRAGAPALPAVPVPALWTDPQGRFHTAHEGPAAPADGPSLLRLLHESEGRDWLGRCGETLRPLGDPSLDWPLAARFREAASWYGQGVAESAHAARILAFVTAVERVIVAADHADLWRTVARRAAILADAAEGGGIAEWQARAASVYEIRSRVVHGALSPFAPQIAAMDPAAAALARAVLCGALAFFESLGLAGAGLSAGRLEAEYRALEARNPWPGAPSRGGAA